MAASEITRRSPVTALAGVGSRRAEALARLGVRTVAELVAHLPMRYERLRDRETIGGALELLGEAERTDDQVSVRGELAACRVAGARGRGARFEATLEDETGTVHLVFFNMAHLAHRLHPGMSLRVTGRLQRRGRDVQMANPRWEPLAAEGVGADAPSDDGPDDSHDDLRLEPVYPATDGLPSRAIAELVQQVLEPGTCTLEDHLPERYRRERDLPELAAALRTVHVPPDAESATRARRRLAFDELLMLQLAVMMKRDRRRRGVRAMALPPGDEAWSRLEATLPFSLTEDQRQVLAEIGADLSGATPMNRLLQGDVGSGKTIVAAMAMLQAAAAGGQAALVAPTELLAEQHHASLARLLAPLDVEVTLVTGSLPAPVRRARQDGLADGSLPLAVGTHALLADRVAFARLALAVIDEQHRFGVHQRASLRERTLDHEAPHVLVMTATPIPRTLSLTVFGDLDVSTIRTLPPGRTPVVTRVVPAARRGRVEGYLAERVAAGEQGYVVVPAIEEGAAELEHVEGRLAALASGPLASARLAAVHGRLAREERESIMEAFHAGTIDVLVATTVIEVGVDVPNATVMVVEQADRFGLAQLHQLRGRVGRGAGRSVCALIADPVTEDGRLRLAAMAETTDGFAISERDLEIRGPGELFGTRQSGLAPFRVATLPRDLELLAWARRDAEAWIERSPDLGGDDESLLRRRVLARHGKDFGLGDVG